jgi:hypothetical protein
LINKPSAEAWENSGSTTSVPMAMAIPSPQAGLAISVVEATLAAEATDNQTTH